MAARKKLPESKPQAKELPEVSEVAKPVPEATVSNTPLPEVAEHKKELPPVGNPEDVLTIGDESIVIKPTKLKYQRDRTAAFYRIIEVYPLPDILAMSAGVIDPERDGDKCLFDFCCAVTDDARFVVRHYDEMDTETIMKMVEIFKRLNKITEKEEQAKNRAAKETSN